MNLGFAAIATVLALGTAFYAWTTIKVLNTRRRKEAAELAAKRARYARQALAGAEPEKAVIRLKQGFGRR